MVLVILVTTWSEETFWPPLEPELSSVMMGKAEMTPSTVLVGVIWGSSKFLVIGCLVGEAVGVTMEPSS